MCIRDSSGDVFVADYNNNLIRKITAAGVVSTYAGSGNAGALNGNVTVAGFTQPTGIAVDSIGNIYVADQGNGLIRKISKAWPVGLSHHSVLKSDLVVYPNPTQEQFSIQGTFHASVKLGVNVLDMQGRVMQQSTYEAHKGDNIFSLSLSNLPAAHYIIQFTEDGIHTRCSNIVKQ